MQNQLVWQDWYNIGIDSIDKEHKKLFSIMNRLYAFCNESSKSQWVCQEGVKYFKDHALKHFTEEEVYMASVDYPEFEIHRRLHDNFRQNTLPALEYELEQSGYSLEAVQHFLGVCAGWLIGHTLTEDRAIAGKTRSKWIDLLPKDEQTAMKQAMTQIIYDLFHLKAKTISDHYGGEKFGNGIYYRLIYETELGQEWETILVFEEKLLLNTIGKMINEPSDTMNAMLVNTSRYVARQCITRINEHFPTTGPYEMKKECLLTYEQFQKAFEKKQPQCSLLFDTGEGYFAYCVIAPHLLSSGLGTSIKAENAVTQINTYLENQNNAKNTNPKILLVDDSATMLNAMKTLLEKDYNVTLAQSGLSAIRSITLDHPDLVLLDYEMPVCDGKQVLEMIRADEHIADIPVIFLTSRSDKKSIQNVISLNPAGYLTKSLKPAEIKQNIDNFFQRNSK